VCRDCGVVLTIPKLQYDHPYNCDVIQHSVQFGATQIGTVRERRGHPHSYQLRRMNQFIEIIFKKFNTVSQISTKFIKDKICFFYFY